jgi:hypothetical protein
LDLQHAGNNTRSGNQAGLNSAGISREAAFRPGMIDPGNFFEKHENLDNKMINFEGYDRII